MSNEYEVRRLTDQDVDEVYKICNSNPLYYQYCPPSITIHAIEEDMKILPPGKHINDKHYIGYFQKGKLIAVMDLIDGYPEQNIAYIGFFMTDSAIQNNGIGTAVIHDLCKCLTAWGYHSVRLAWVKGNPQSEHFWTKNQFVPIMETRSSAADEVILAERRI